MSVILIVDRSALCRELLTHLLEGHGFSVAHAADSTAGLGALMIVTGTSGWLVDLRTGAIHAHKPGHVRVALHRKESE